MVFGVTALFLLAAVAEIAGCFAFWAVVRLSAPALWLVPGGLALGVFAYLLTFAPPDAAGRTFAGYGGVYIATAILWLWLVEGRVPDRYDLIGAALCLLGAAIILMAPRGAV
jgi:small multidrug resistance family-3 protein